MSVVCQLRRDGLANGDDKTKEGDPAALEKRRCVALTLNTAVVFRRGPLMAAGAASA
jgi:hypothetical protein